jgi:hypothetical protein
MNASNGCETSLRTLTDCGTCGNPCEIGGSGESCVTGTCVPTMCDATTADCEAKPDLTGKAHFVRELQNPETITGLAQQRAIMAGLFPANQTALQLELLDVVLDGLPEFSGKADPYFLSSYASGLLTPMCRSESTAIMRAALDEFARLLDSTALRFLREAQQADQECSFLRDKQT